jgi:murein DD-endopeptidase MepM/ murein hydrolase activator NlpD
LSKKRLYTYFVAGNSAKKVWYLSIPYPILAAVGVLALVGLVAICAGTLSYGRMLLKVVDLEKYISENDKLRTENHNYKVQTAQLGEKIDFLETLSHKLEFFSGMKSPKAVGGVGGGTSNNQARPVAPDPIASLAAYNKKVSSLEDSYRSLDDLITENVLWLAAQPNIMPVKGYITEGWGRRSDPFNPAITEHHPAVDISAPKGKAVVATADAVVIFAGQRAGYGNMVVLDHKFGMTTRYGHLQRIDVQVGQHISRGEIIGSVGETGRTTGPHLHYEVWQRNIPVNPAKYFPRIG